MSNRPFYKLASRYLTMNDRDSFKSDGSGNVLVLPWLDATIKWSEDHPVRQKLWRGYIALTTSPASHYRQLVYWPIRTFYERGRRGWSERDLWSFDYYLSGVIADGVDRLREIGHGWPGDPMTPEEWDDILIAISKGFRAHSEAVNMDYLGDREHYDPEVHKPIEDALMADWKKGGKLFVKWFGHLWD